MKVPTSHKMTKDMQNLKLSQSFHVKGVVNYLNMGIQLKQENAVCICRHFL